MNDGSFKSFVHLHRLVGMGIVVTSEILHGVVVSTLAWNARCGFDSCSRDNISHFHHTHDISFGKYAKTLTAYSSAITGLIKLLPFYVASNV